jgi:hypothetical protein
MEFAVFSDDTIGNVAFIFRTGMDELKLLIEQFPVFGREPIHRIRGLGTPISLAPVMEIIEAGVRISQAHFAILIGKDGNSAGDFAQNGIPFLTVAFQGILFLNQIIEVVIGGIETLGIAIELTVIGVDAHPNIISVPT